MAIEEFEAQMAALEATLGGTEAVVASFEGELKRMQSTVAEAGKDVGTLSRGLSSGLRRAFDGLVFDGHSLSQALDTVARSMVNAAYGAAVRPVANHFGGLIASGISGLFGDFNALSEPGKAAPTVSAAGPSQAVARGAEGPGVARAVTVVMNITTPDAAGFKRSEGQIAAQMSRALGRAERMR